MQKVIVNKLRAYSLGVQNLLNSKKRQTLESSTTSNQKNENSVNRIARNEGSFHWLKTGDDDIFAVRYSNYSRPTGSLFTKFEISGK